MSNGCLKLCKKVYLANDTKLQLKNCKPREKVFCSCIVDRQTELIEIERFEFVKQTN